MSLSVATSIQITYLNFEVECRMRLRDGRFSRSVSTVYTNCTVEIHSLFTFSSFFSQVGRRTPGPDHPHISAVSAAMYSGEPSE